MFEDVFKKLKEVIKKTSNIELEDNYDALFVQKLAESNILNENRSESSKSKQSHIAISQKKAFDLFPKIEIENYINEELSVEAMKSFYILRVPMKIYEKNIRYSNPTNAVDLEFNDGITISNVSIKYSRPNSPQLELGNTTQSDNNFKEFRKCLYESDFIIILKVKEKVEYDIFIVKKDDSEYFNLNNVVEYMTKRYAKNFVDFDKIHISKDKKQIFAENRLFYGAPGTGKSFNIQNYIKDSGLTNYNNKIEHPNVFRTTLHPESSYHDFVGQIMPVVTKDKNDKDIIKYDFKPQVFTLALERALEKSEEPVFLILEEMSRANVAAVFGDIFQLLDRDEDSRSEYLIDNEQIQKYLNKQFSKKNIGLNLSKIYIPHNLFIIGTVNTSDQNVFVMDTAFKRRFEFEYLDANYEAKDEVGKPLNNFVFRIGKMNFSWINFIHNLNEFIVDDLNGLGLTEDKQLGQFFIKFKLDDSELTEQSLVADIENQVNYSVNFNKLKGKLLQYLWNDIRGASYSEKSLFDSSIKSFGELYNKFGNKEQVFSKNFLDKFILEVPDNETQN
ncbi:AAA family ATPase [Macrococcoides caseolyticum]|uniref:AAA family ATPase n=1 Tax=Macrococcoides caseolyticum TaxID=69966 RepID=UPI00119DA91C|nr:AAA family ATPase [Macrococcus caseolyticus]